MSDHDLDHLAITTIRTLAIDAVERANSGHPGMPLGMAPLAYLLFGEVMRHDPADPAWWDRDRFVLSAGHGSALLYSVLHLAGYDRPTLDDLRAFRQWDSVTPGHPEVHELAGVETTTGPLGQGFANGVGMALAAERLAAEFNRDGHDIVDHHVYAICSDGDVMEGISHEAASLAGHLRLGRLIYFYDDNAITIDGSTDLAMSEDVLARFDAYGWHTDRVDDANDLDALRRAAAAAREDDRPSLVAVRSVIGYGAPSKAGTAGVHGSPLGADELEATKQALGWDHDEPFTVPDEARSHFDQRERGAAARADWDERWEAYRAAHPDLADEFARRMTGRLPDGWVNALPTITEDQATRKSSGTVINAVAPVVPELFGGSADLAGSNNTDVEGGGDFSADDRSGRNVRFGVREHAMAAISNGMALHGGLIPYAASFLVFTDYARPAIRLSAIMDAKVVWVFTHDSIGLGEDGPTHQPVEHLASLRAMPEFTTFRPADGVEVAAAWKVALERPGPVLMALTRQGVPYLGDRPADGPERGGYVLRDTDGDPDVILIGTGSEVQHCVGAAELLAEDDIAARVVSLPSWEVFADQHVAYREEVLPPHVTARVAVEAAATFGWERFVGAQGAIVGLDRFGASAPAERVFEELGFTAENVARVARKVVGG